MATKNNPGKFDCYANALPDEPMFVLLARDSLAPHVVAIWAAARSLNTVAMQNAIHCLVDEATKKKGVANPDKILEALRCSADMAAWRKANPYV